MLRKIFTGNGMVSVLAVLLALILGGLLIAATDERVAATSGYFFARPGDFLVRRLARRHAAPTSRCSRARSSTPGAPASPDSSRR